MSLDKPKPNEQKQESILGRKKIEAPPHYVSVYHEMLTSAIESVDKKGLVSAEKGGLGGDKRMRKRNELLDKHRPSYYKNLSRFGVFAYPYLEEGHGLFGADQRFIKKDEEELREEFERFVSFDPKWLAELGVSTPEEYVAKMKDPEYLREQYPGEVLEMKVDPNTAAVGDMRSITEIESMVRRGESEEEAVEFEAKYYWGGMVLLKDFLKWYRKPEYAEDGNTIIDEEMYENPDSISSTGYCILKGAPGHYLEGEAQLNWPEKIHQPEILIEGSIPQKHLRVLEDQ